MGKPNGDRRTFAWRGLDREASAERLNAVTH